MYIIPNIMMTIGDFYRNIQLTIQTRGYEQWRNGEANLLIFRGLVGRLSNTPNVGFTHEVTGVVDYLTSHGVRALPGRRFDTPIGHMPPAYNKRDDEVPSDEEDHHIVAVLTVQDTTLEIHAGDTSPGATVPWPMDNPVYDSEPEDDYLEFIQYLANQATPNSAQEDYLPIWDDSDELTEPEWVNPLLHGVEYAELLQCIDSLHCCLLLELVEPPGDDSFVFQVEGELVQFLYQLLVPFCEAERACKVLTVRTYGPARRGVE